MAKDDINNDWLKQKDHLLRRTSKIGLKKKDKKSQAKPSSSDPYEVYIHSTDNKY